MPVSKETLQRANAIHGVNDLAGLDAVHELNEIESERAEQLHKAESQYDKIEKMQDDIRRNGITKATAQEINEVTTDMLAENQASKLALEHFSMYPSFSGVDVALEELSDTHKKIAIGVGIFAALGIVYKLYKAIRNYFSKSGSGGGSGGDVAQTAEEYAKKVKRVEEVENQLRDAAANIGDLAELTAQMDMERDKSYQDMVKDMEPLYSQLLHRLLTKNDDKINAFINLYKDSKKYDNSLNSATKALGDVVGGMDDWANRGVLKEELKKRVDSVHGTYPPKELGNNIEETRQLIADLKELANEPAELDVELLKQADEGIQNPSRYQFFAMLKEHSPTNTSSYASDENSKRLLDKLKYWEDAIRNFLTEYESKIDKETTDMLSGLINYVALHARNQLSMIILFNGVARNFNIFAGKFGTSREKQVWNWIGSFLNDLTRGQVEALRKSCKEGEAKKYLENVLNGRVNGVKPKGEKEDVNAK